MQLRVDRNRTIFNVGTRSLFKIRSLKEKKTKEEKNITHIQEVIRRERHGVEFSRKKTVEAANQETKGN